MWIKRNLEEFIVQNDSNLLLIGPRQVGKSSIIAHSLGIPYEAWLGEKTETSPPYLVYNLLRDEEFVRLSRSPQLLRQEVLAAAALHPNLVVVLDEIQRIPALLNETQSIMDFYKKSQIKFVLTGSSARKLKKRGNNLLPGRVISKTLSPLQFNEWQPYFSLDQVLCKGSLPGILTAATDKQWDILKSYVNIYLKEEIQDEGIARGIGPFSRFIELAAGFSGKQINYSSLSRDTGVPYSTIRNYFQILEDTLVGTLIHPYTGKTAKRLSLHPKLYLYDLGVRNALTNLNISTSPLTEIGLLFEHFIFLEIIRMAKVSSKEPGLFFWRTHAGAEVDCVIEINKKLYAIEIKAKREIYPPDTSGLTSFANTYPEKVEKLFVFSLTENPALLGEINILPWQKGLEEIKTLMQQSA